MASRGRVFFGCWFSTFTGFINRIRGYRAAKDKLPGYEKGILPTSYYYATLNRKFEMNEYVPLRGGFFNREFPTSWRDIDKGIEELQSTMAWWLILLCLANLRFVFVSCTRRNMSFSVGQVNTFLLRRPECACPVQSPVQLITMATPQFPAQLVALRKIWSFWPGCKCWTKKTWLETRWRSEWRYFRR